ncbi:hypothetical protein Cgig2_028488 [Carnegiea gigantea]|uniref:Uncharacterized protein n=1 Tax=Carnegiea gigantea TaxID=171969 RepID=A0A9Q1GIM8_9CARY|nr:hypothetical protein Cgig2_028488 [Carnegiea gigantea]
MEATSSVRPLRCFEYVPTTATSPPIGITLQCSPITMRGCERPLMLPEIGGHGKRTATVPLGPMHMLATVQATDGRQSNHGFDTIYNTLSTNRLNDCIIAEFYELREALHELADKGRFLRRGPCFLRRESEPTRPEPQDEECFIEVVATIAGGYAEGITWSSWKAQLRGAQ